MTAANKDSARYPCPCCGHVVFEEPPGSYDICPICGWEDDLVQLRWPDLLGGANRPSLIEAQGNFVAFGASEGRHREHVREPMPGEPVDAGWRPVDRAVDILDVKGDEPAWTVAADGSVRVPTSAHLAVPEEPWPDDVTVLYYWRPTYWHRRD